MLTDVSRAGAQLLTDDPENAPEKDPAEYLYIPGINPVMLGDGPTSQGEPGGWSDMVSLKPIPLRLSLGLKTLGKTEWPWNMVNKLPLTCGSTQKGNQVPTAVQNCRFRQYRATSASGSKT